MPYSSTNELPQSVRDKYSEKCQRAYMHAFNSVHEDTGDEGRASAAGHSAAQDCEAKNKMTDELITADFEEVVQQAIPFKIFSGLLKAHRGPDGRMRLQGVASSTIKDRHGDTMERTALEDMVKAANENLTIFLNHSYNVPEDVAGSVEQANMIERGMDNVGNPIWDLDFGIVVNDANPRAVDAFNAIEKGTKLGLSIGAMIPEGGAVRNKKTGAYRFSHVDLLETSIVGIPANPRSWVQNAVKALKAATTTQLGTPTLTLDGGHYVIEGELNGLQINDSTSSTSSTVDFVTFAACGEDCEGGTCKKPKGHSGEHSAMRQDSTEPEDLPDQSGDPDEDAGEDLGPDEVPALEDPEVQDAKVQIILIDTDSQEASEDESEPDTESDDSASDSVESTDVSLATTLTESLDSLEAAASAIVGLRRQLDETIEERDAARRERDEISAMSVKVIEETSQIIEKLASMPVGRKAVLREARDNLSGLERLYGPEILKLLRKD